MKARIEVKNRKEAELIRRGLADPQTRALVLTMGALLPLMKDEQRRVMNWVCDKFQINQRREV